MLCTFRKKLQSRLAESEEATSATQAKLTSLEKTKNRIASELEDTGYALEDMRNQVAGMEKSKKKFDAEINDWKAKYDARGQELDASQRDARVVNTEVGRAGLHTPVVHACTYVHNCHVLLTEMWSLRSHIPRTVR